MCVSPPTYSEALILVLRTDPFIIMKCLCSSIGTDLALPSISYYTNQVATVVSGSPSYQERGLWLLNLSTAPGKGFPFSCLDAFSPETGVGWTSHWLDFHLIPTLQ